MTFVAKSATLETWYSRITSSRGSVGGTSQSMITDLGVVLLRSSLGGALGRTALTKGVVTVGMDNFPAMFIA
eukprot:CAMPEP_0117609036 /NCGR_PEP_ID=MMETSP0784-20121206/81113_1 /TAXON_ID=39447 /ORGANISM="" /LENGTH=71 /DNA_ID=CAMNT_0005412321 /DNA_START=155 /DNA_END=370 /DNA_ORIENTATION=-